jgi:asparagine synthetase B (glutamine-hydrolysing)
MSALAGVYDPDADAIEIERDLAGMRRVLELPDFPCTAETASGPGAGCVLVDYRAGRHPPRIAHDDRDDLWLAFFGELYGGDELRARLGAGAAALSDADVCLRLYLREGADVVERLNGHFTLVVCRRAERHVSIVTDPFGYRALFLAARGRRLVFASEMKAILAVWHTTPAVDDLALVESLRLGWPLADHTWLEPIRMAAPGSWYALTPSGTAQRRYFRFRLRQRERPRALADHSERLGELLRRAVRRAIAGPGRVGLALSGGLDSRAMLLAAAADDRKPDLAYTFGAGASRDVRYAGQLADIAGVPHLHLSYEPGYLGRLLAPIVWRTEGLLPFSTATFTSLHFHPVLAERADVLLYGHAGDALTGKALPPGISLWRSRAAVIERLWRACSRTPDAALQRVLRPSFYRRVAADVWESFRATFAEIDHDVPADLFDVWIMENRQRRGTFSSSIVDRYRFAVRAPFLDRDLVDHLQGAPVRWRTQQCVYKRMIVASSARAATVPWAHTAAPLHSHWLADSASQARAHILGRLRRPRFLAARRADVPFRDLRADTAGDWSVAESIRTFAAHPSFPGDVFDRAGIEEVVRRHWEGGEDLTYLVSMLATFAAAYRLFLWEQPRVVPIEAVPPR